MPLPLYVHRRVRNGKVTLTFQKHRGTAKAGPRVRLPDDPNSPEFWKKYNELLRKRATEPMGEKTVAAMVAAYRRSPNWEALKPSTRKTYDHYLDIFEKRLGRFDARQITPRVLLEMRDSLAGTPVGANSLIAIVKTVFRFGIPREFAKTNPAREIEPITIKTDGYDPWPEWAIDLVLAKARWEVQMFTALALYTGQRSGDVVAMRLGDIEKGRVLVKQSKTGKRLSIRIHQKLAPFIEQARSRGFIYMVPGLNGRKHDTDSWRALWKREMDQDEFAAIREFNAAEAAEGRHGIVPHGLRKSAVVKLREAGCEIEEIQAITGQSRPMVEHYAAKVDQAMMADRGIKKWEEEDSREGVQTPRKT